MPSIPITLLCHFGKVDVSSLKQHPKYNYNIMKHTTEIQGGLITLYPSKIHPMSVNPKFQSHAHHYNLTVFLRDTMAQAPAGQKSLKDLGEVIGWEKIDLGDDNRTHAEVISAMDKLIRTDARKYFEYAANDSTVTMLYAASLYGYNQTPDITLTSAGARVMKKIMMEYLGCSNTQEYDRRYRGLKRVDRGLVQTLKKGELTNDLRAEFIKS